jgi:hypothetical protein
VHSPRNVIASTPLTGRTATLTPAFATLALLFLVTHVTAGELEQYRYVLDTSADTKVCSHMQRVYNSNFRYPWKRPFLTKRVDDPEYGANSPYSFPKLPGVAHDALAAFAMSFSRKPSSPEFEAIEWREGRIDYGQPAGDGPALVAEFDIDNDGKQELVIKSGFVRTYESDGGRGGWDYVYVLWSRRMQDLPNPIPLSTASGRTGQATLASGRTGQATLTLSPEFPYRFIRPFRLDGTTYIATYGETYKNKRMTEFVDILKYLGGGHFVKIGERSPIQVSRVCRLRMQPVRGAK